MKLSVPLRKLIDKTDATSFSYSIEEQVIIDLVGYLDNPKKLTETHDLLKELHDVPGEKKDVELTKLYHTTESLLISHTQQTYTLVELRNEIKSKYDIQAFSPFFKVPFLDLIPQAYFLYKYIILSLCEFLSENSKSAELGPIVSELQKVPLFSELTLNTSVFDFSKIEGIILSKSIDEITSAFSHLCTLLSHKITEHFGENTALKVLQGSVESLKPLYSEDILLLVKNISQSQQKDLKNTDPKDSVLLPDPVEDAQLKKAESRIRELEEKISEFLQQNKELEDTKVAMINLLEDARELEQELIVERDRAKGIIQSMNEAVLLVDKDGLIITANPIALSLLRTTHQNCIGKNVRDAFPIYCNEVLVPESDHPGIKTLETKKGYSITLDDNFYVQGDDNKFIPIEINTSPIMQEEVSGAVIIFRDVTGDKEKRRQIEELVKQRTQQVKEEQAKLTASINSLLRGYIITDIDGKILLANKSIGTIFDRKDTQFNDIREIQPFFEGKFDLVSQFYAAIKEANEKGDTSSKYDITYRSKYLKVFIHPIYLSESDHTIIGVVILIEDVTEEKVLQRSRDEFFSIASHELRTPLTAIRGNASLLMNYKETLSKEESEKMIERIYDASLRLINIVNEFLNSSRLEQGKMSFDLQDIHAHAFVNEVITEVKGMAEEKNLYLKVEGIENKDSIINADKDKLKEVLINLIGNAIKFTEKGGISVRLAEEGDKLCFYIKDTGKGIPPENLHLLFRKFQQASNNILTRDNSQGTGLGLYITKLMVEGMHGEITIHESAVNKGSTFLLKIPLQNK